MNAAPTPQTYEQALAMWIAEGWQVVSEGPSGAQLKKAKEMRTLDKVCAAVGVVMLFFFIVPGVILIGVAIIDYVVLTKEKTFFLQRSPSV